MLCARPFSNYPDIATYIASYLGDEVGIGYCIWISPIVIKKQLKS